MENLDTTNYINVSDLISEIESREISLEELRGKIFKMEASVKDEDINTHQTILEAYENTIFELRGEEEEQVRDLCKLLTLRGAIQQYNNFPDAEVINEIHFESHLRTQTMDIHGIDTDGFPFCYIDWDSAIEAMRRNDYKSIEFEGDVFLIKAA